MDQSHEAFTKHMDEQLDLYKKVAIITLAELAGKEHVIGDAFLAHVIRANSPDVTYVTFDFHEYCRGMRFENVSILTDGIKDIIKDMRYCWVDNRGVICEQNGVFRVNCVDCLDRTNVVQTATARIVMETQFRKLGLLPPEETLPPSCRRTYQQIWANNGDVISQQYAGTAALKGDFTRTGERKFTGMMKDGVNSANRYYLRFRDAHRQAAIDLTLGQPVSESLLVPSADIEEGDGIDPMEKEENVKTIIEDTKKMLIVEPEQCLGGWALINADPVEGDSDQQDMDMILLLSQRSVYVAWYDDQEESVTKYQRIYLEDVDKIELGMEPAMFKSKFPCLRMVYHYQADEGLFHMFRAPSTRFFNNKATTILTHEEARESLRMIADTFKSAQEIMSLDLEIVEKQKLEKKKATAHPEVIDVHQQQQENSLAGIKLPRDISADIDTSGGVQQSDEVVRLQTGQPEASGFTPPRSRSPLGFLSALSKPSLPKPTLPSFGSSLNPARFSLPKPNLKVNLQNLNLIRKIRLNKGQDDEKSESDHYNSDVEVEVVDKENKRASILLDEEVNKEVVLDSCGILASSPNQILLSSLNLKADKRRYSHSESPATPLSSQQISGRPKSEGGTIFTFEEDEAVEPNTPEPDESKTADADKEQIDGSKPQNLNTDEDKHHPVTATDGASQPDVSDGPENVYPDAEDDEYCVIESDEVKAILDKCHQLHHPHMKTSLSDTTLSLSAGQDPSLATQPIPDTRDTGLVSRFKLKMSNFSKPAVARPADPLISKNHIRKSQRAMEVFEQLIKEELPSQEINSRFIFI